MTPEQIKLLHETYKHLTTLSTGAIVIASALLAAPDFPTRLASIVAIGCMVVVSVLSLLMMFSLAERDYQKNKPKAGHIPDTIVSVFILMMFGLAVGTLAYVAVRKISGAP